MDREQELSNMLTMLYALLKKYDVSLYLEERDNLVFLAIKDELTGKTYAPTKEALVNKNEKS